MTSQDPRTRDLHETHDRLLVVRYAVADELAPDETATVADLIARCTECAALVDELRVVQHAVAVSPAPVRTRDFFLTPDQAEWLRPNPWQRFLSRFSAPRAATLRPLAGATLAIGIVLVGASAVLPRTSSAPASDQTAPMAKSTAAPEAVFAPDASAPTNVTMMTLPGGSPDVAGDAGHSGQSRLAPDASLPAGDARSLQDAQPSGGLTDLVPTVASPGPLSVSSMQGVGGGSPPPAAMSGAAAASPAASTPVAEIAAPVPTSTATPVAESQAAATAVASSGDAVTQALLIAGVLLAIVSVAVLALLWLARRSADPLLR
ncbi:MAG: hypothetical protein U0869_13715 [Chloroflexota bacterium]